MPADFSCTRFREEALSEPLTPHWTLACNCNKMSDVFHRWNAKLACHCVAPHVASRDHDPWESDCMAISRRSTRKAATSSKTENGERAGLGERQSDADHALDRARSAAPRRHYRAAHASESGCAVDGTARREGRAGERSAISRGWCRRMRLVTDEEKPLANKALEGLHERHDAVPAAGPDLGATE